MIKRLFALFLTLVMVLQPVLPAAAEAMGEDAAVLTAEEMVETTEAVEETEEVTEEPTEAAEEATEEVTEEATEKTEAATEEPTVETEEPAETTEPDGAAYAVVRLVCDVDGVTFHVYPAATEEDPEPEEILAQEDGSYWLVPGEYWYSASMGDEELGEKKLFVVTDEAEQTIRIALLHDETSDGIVCDEIYDYEYPAYDSDQYLLAYGNCGDHMKWYYYESGRLLIQGYGMMSNYSPRGNKSTAPWFVMQDSHNYMITRIQFSNSSGTIGITSIGDYAFRCYQYGNQAYLRISVNFNIKFPNTLRRIGKNAFEDFKYWKQWTSNGSPIWSSSETLVLPDSLTVIDDGAFKDAAIGTVEMPQSLRQIGDNAFSGCSNADIILPKYLEEIGSYAFDGCYKVTYKPAGSLYYVASSAFANSGLRELPDLSYFPYIPAYAFRGTKISTANIPASIQQIGGSAFENCTNLTSVTMNAAVDAIPSNCFNGCSNLKTFIIPDGVKTVSNGAFRYCRNLKEITIPVGVTSIGENAFSSCTGLEIIHYAGTAADWNAIAIAAGNEVLDNAVLDSPDNYRIIYQFVEGAENPNPKFADKGTALTLQAASKTGYIFGGWYKEDTFTTRVTTIPAENTENITLYAKWTPITYSVKFDANGGTGSIAQKSVKYDEAFDIPSTGVSLARYKLVSWNTARDGTGTAFTPGQSVSNLCNTQGVSMTLYAQWVLDMGNIVWTLDANGKLTVSGTGAIPDFVNVSEVPWDSSKVQSVSLGTELTRIGMNAFVNCVGLTSITIPENIKEIGNSAFQGCTALKTVDITCSVTSFGDYVFRNCKALETFEYYGTGTFGVGMFYGCESLEGIVIPDGITVIKAETFRDCTSFVYADLPASVKEIQKNAFYNCSALEVVNYAGTLKQLGSVSIAEGNQNYLSDVLWYKGLYNAGEIYIESWGKISGTYGKNIRWKLGFDGTLTLSGTGEMTDDWFASDDDCWEMYDVEKIVIGEGITNIGKAAFKGGKILTTIRLPKSLKEIKENAFSNCPALTTVRYSGKQEQWDAITIASGNEALTNAKLLLSTYMLIYKNVDGTANPNPDMADKDSALTLKDATRTGYLFGGWYKEDSFKTKVTSIPAGNEADVTLYAKWTPISYTVTFDANGGTGSIAKKTVSYGELAELPKTGFIRTGYTFTGWNTKADGKGTAYTLGQTVTNLSSTQGANVTLYAQWKANSYQVKFDLKGGEGQLTDQTVAYDQAFQLPNEKSVTREDYHLIGWAVMIDGENKTYQPGQEIKNLTSENGAVITFLAQWGKSGTFGSLTWELTEAGELTISGSGEMGSVGYPWEDYASTVRRLEVKSGVTSIAEFAFSGFEALEEVVLADTVTVIGQSAFTMCGKLKKLDLGSGLRVIYNYAFESCDSLEQVDLPASASSISPTAFENCGNLQNFHVASGNETYCDVDGVLFWTGKVLLANFPGGRTGSYTVPGSVKTIGDCAFYASKLTEVVLPSGLKTIGDYCFRYSTVSQLTLSAGLENLGVGAFAGCQKLKSVTIPGSIKTVPDSAFWGSGLETVTLGDGITTIEKEAFLSCALAKVTVPSSVTSIGEHALGYEANRMDYDKVSGFTIVGMEGSAAQQYADSNGFQFEKIPMELQLDIPDTVTAGTTIQLKAQVVPAQYDTGKYTWSLNDPTDSAYVTLSGSSLTAKTVSQVRNVTVVCTSGSLQAKKTITIIPALAGIEVYQGEQLIQGSLTVDLNETDTVILTAKAMPEGAAMEPEWAWSDTREAFGTYTQENGILTIKLDKDAKLGTITLTVTDQMTRKSTAVKLTTTRKSSGSISILGAPDTLTSGKSVQLYAQFVGSPANTKVIWSLDDEDKTYASLTAAGKLTAAQITERHTITVYADAADGGSSGACQITLVPKVSSLSLTLNDNTVGKTATVYLNDTKEMCLAINTWPADASSDVTWTVSKNKIANTQIIDGRLYLKNLTDETGNITVKATARDGSKKTASLQIKVARRPDFVEILDNKGNEIDGTITLKGKQSYTFKTDMWAYDGGKITDKELVWYVDPEDEAYVTVKNGKVTVKSFASEGPVTVPVEARVKAFPSKYSTVLLELLPNIKSGITIHDTYGKSNLNNTTYRVDMSEEILFLEAETVGLPDSKIIWGPTKANGVVTVDDDGAVWLNKAGTVTVTATNPASKKKASFKLVVTDNVKKLTIQNAPAELAGGKKVTLKAAVTPSKPTNSKLTWFLVDNGGGAASITAAGALTAAKVTGVHTVKAAVKTQDGTVVSEPVDIRIVPSASRVVISGMPHNNTVDLNTYSSLKLTARVYPSVSAQKVNWTSSNKSVRVDGNGNVTILSGVKPGSVTLTATAADGSRKKTTVKLNLVRYVTSISMVSSAVVTGGKSLKLTATVDKSATNKKVVWSMAGSTTGCTLSNGTLKTKAVTTAQYITVRATAADGSGIYAECNVTILPK